MPLLDLVCIGCWEVVFRAVELGFEVAGGKGRLDVLGDAVGKGGLDVSGVVLDVEVEGSLLDIGTEEGNSDCDGPLDKSDKHGGVGERLLSKGSEVEI
ncbi:hypothetical protein FCV25MIE_22111 [Fagus crenata]